MSTRYATNPNEYQSFDTTRLRQEYLVESLFAPGELNTCYTHHDRVLIAGAVPTGAPLLLDAPELTGTAYFLERREVGVFNVGQPGSVIADGEQVAVGKHEGVYVGKGARRVELASDDADDPARFYLVSTPAHREIGLQAFTLTDGEALELGSEAESNRRTLTKLIHAGSVQSCQLMLGFTTLHGASMWNTMPAHLHDRRTEIYLYVDLDEDARVFHLMGPPDETRHLVVANEQAIISPGWSIHAGFGTSSYSFIWAMGGETYNFDDMDPVPPTVMK